MLDFYPAVDSKHIFLVFSIILTMLYLYSAVFEKYV